VGAGFGTLPAGTGSFGTQAVSDLIVSDSATIAEAVFVSVPFKVLTAVSLSTSLVKLDFSGFVDLDHATNFDTTNYTIAGLTVLNVDPFGSSKSVIIQTSTQSNITYTVVVNSTPGQIQGIGGDQLDPLFDSASFLGDVTPATFIAVAQSRRKIRLTFSQLMNVNAAFIDPTNYLIQGFDGSGINIDTIQQAGPDNTRAEILLAEDLVPFKYYTLQISVNVRTVTNEFIFPDRQLLQWKEVIPRPIRVEFDSFSGEVTGGLLGTPAGQVFFSPAFGTSVPNSVIQVDNVSVCTRAFDVYTMPSLPDPQILFTFPAPSGTSGLIGAAGGVLRASAYRLGLAVMNLSDAQEDTLLAPTDGTPEGLLEEPIDITRASFLNDDRWRIFPGTGASLGSFLTADNTTPIGPGPTVGPFPIV
jgi:hypothetical protein